MRMPRRFQAAHEVVFSHNSLVPFFFRDGSRPNASALVFKRQLHTSAVCGYLAFLDFHIQFHNLGNAQVTQSLGRSLDGIFRRILP